MATVNHNIRIVFGTLLFGWSVALAVRFLLPRALGVEIFGHYAAAEALAQSLMLSVSWGFSEWASRTFPETPQTAPQDSLRVVRAMVTLIPFALVALLGVCLALGYETALLPLFLGVALFVALIEVNAVTTRLGQLSGHYQTLGKLTRKNRLIWGSGTLALSGLCLFHIISPWETLILFLSFSIAVEIARFGFTLRTAGIRSGDEPFLRGFLPVIAASLPFFLNRVFVLLYLRLPVVLVSRLPSPGSLLPSPAQEAGILGVALTVNGMILMFIPAFQAIFMPHLAQAKATRSPHFVRECHRTLGLVALLASGISGGILISADSIVTLLFGHAFRLAAPLVRVNAGVLFITYLLVVFTYLLMLEKKEKTLAIVSAIGVAVVLGSGALMVTGGWFSTGALAASVATGVNEIFILLCILPLLPRTLWRSDTLRGALPYSVVSLGLAALVWHLTVPMGLWGQAAVATLFGLSHFCLAALFWHRDLRRIYADWN